ncbi:radical SAM protein [bacterium]|nr:radical SAM protein [bacterium]
MEYNSDKNLFAKYKKDYLFYFSRVLNKVMVEPDMIQIMLTSRCNIKCKICDVWKQSFRDELTTEEAKNLIDQAIKMEIKSIYFTGGEALLRKDIFELINYATRPGIITTINTNGSFITDEIAKKIVSSKLRDITFSIDSATPAIHNYIRGDGVFEKAIHAMELINHYKKEFGRGIDSEERRLYVGLVSVIMRDNMEGLSLLVKLAEKMQCCDIVFQPLVYNGSLLENIDFESNFWIRKEDISKLENSFREIECMKREMSKRLSIGYMPEKTIQHFKRERRVNSCFAGFNRFFINPQGDISFVCFEAFGNIKHDSLKKVWHSEKAYEIREKLKKCEVNCTQFCSERPESESIENIHKNFLDGIKTFPQDIRQNLLRKEYRFLESILHEASDKHLEQEIKGIQRRIDESVKIMIKEQKNAGSVLCLSGDGSNLMSAAISKLYGFEIIKNWHCRFPLEEISVAVKFKQDLPFEPKIDKLRERVNLRGLTVLELGCLEGMHSSMLQMWGAKKVIAIEGRKENFLKSLIIKNAFKLDKCEFLFGNVQVILDSLSLQFDLCLALGILYHLNDPVSLMYCIGKLTDKLFVWTHYADANYPVSSIETIGYNGRVYRGKYMDEDVGNMLGSIVKKVFWLFEDDLLAVVRDAGFKNVELIQKENHEHGPAITFFAQK